MPSALVVTGVEARIPEDMSLSVFKPEILPWAQLESSRKMILEPKWKMLEVCHDERRAPPKSCCLGAIRGCLMEHRRGSELKGRALGKDHEGPGARAMPLPTDHCVSQM